MQVLRWLLGALALLMFASGQAAVVNEKPLVAEDAKSMTADSQKPACIESRTGQVTIDKGIGSVYEVTAPCHDDGSRPLVVFVNYVSEADRDYFSMPSVSLARSTPRSSVAYTYRYLAERLAARGFVTVRNDPLGVGCREGEHAAADALSPFCIRAFETARVERSDYAEVLGKVLLAADASLSTHLANRGVVFILHSGTTLVLKDVFEGAYGLEPSRTGVVGVSALIGTGMANDQWQTSGVFQARIDRCESQYALRLHFSRCVQRALGDSYAVGRIPEESRRLINSECERIGAACKKTAVALLNEITETVSKNFLEGASQGDKYSSPAGYVGTLRSHLDIVSSTDSPCSLLVTMRPAVRLIYGDADVALSGDQQVREWVSCGGSAADAITLANVGHTLGPNVHTGPMTEESAELVINAAVDVARRLSNRLSSP
ncbi:hypothetical protein [Piscinibacter terrae]|uniref:hypothetical protein n=1 Tax=Piscinibacter terrae TaxID=2496871 RepID=UPI000F59C143|nr:hypothetical protein [Albitalea terrae]